MGVGRGRAMGCSKFGIGGLRAVARDWRNMLAGYEQCFDLNGG